MIPYEFLGGPQVYIPDFLIRLTDGTNLILEIKGFETEEDREKHTSAHRWVAAVNNWEELGRWALVVCKEPRRLGEMLGKVR